MLRRAQAADPSTPPTVTNPVDQLEPPPLRTPAPAFETPPGFQLTPDAMPPRVGPFLTGAISWNTRWTPDMDATVGIESGDTEGEEEHELEDEPIDADGEVDVEEEEEQDEEAEDDEDEEMRDRSKHLLISYHYQLAIAWSLTAIGFNR